MILVSLGTHHQPFDRLVLAADRLAVELGEEVILQRGASRLPAPHAQVHDLLAPDRFEVLLREARVVVLHGGSSSFLQARALGRRPIVVPRRPEHGEHVDDHQVRFVLALPPEEAAVAEPGQLLEAVRGHSEGALPTGDSRSLAFCARFGPLVDGLVSGGRPAVRPPRDGAGGR
jgi:UDP-N-acetylglucosamine transferase subunit ALG13